MNKQPGTLIAPEHRRPHSLRLRLMLWYGVLLIIALGFFATLVLLLTADAINQSVDSSVRAEARLASSDVSRELSSTNPYWPAQLSLTAIDTYREPGVTVEVVDTNGYRRYPLSTSAAKSIPLSGEIRRAVLAGQPPVWYTTTVDGEQVRVEALPVRVPSAKPGTNVINADGTLSGSGPVVGLLLVAKSLTDVNATLFLLQTLLLLAGIATLAGTLVGSWIIGTRVLRPLAGIVGTARTIAASTAHGTRLGNLSKRVPRPGGHDELAQVVDTFNEMLASLESATQTQRRFVADASHELRAPLTTIQGNLAFLQRHLDELPPEEYHTMLSDAHEETLRLAELVEELLLLARADASADTSAEADTLEAPKEEGIRQTPPVELDHAALQLVRQLRRRLSVEGSPLKLELGHIEPVRVRGDEESLRRVMLILLDNALKYTPGNGESGPGRVIVSLERIDEQAVLRVRDTGIGIDPDDLPHLFERFYRADRARSRHGTGLGLPIARTLVEQLGGHITAESIPGEGSTFSVWLPLT
ncbi:MAG TPA: HAMP domain-containing sensor histidine kinase [Ktedonobacteraceae bacterium]|nr:HAMP domain-containing sensor histidine kinase [Ktedonobacteraceae bacterium]